MTVASLPVAILFGASGGIGAACAHTFAAHGAIVCLSARRAEQLAAVGNSVRSAGGTVWTGAADVSQADQVQSVVNDVMAEYGRIDVVDHFAAVIGVLYRATWQLDHADWTAALATNMTGPFNILRATLPVMVAQGRGTILMASSPFGENVTPGMGAYAASRAGSHALVRQVAAELKNTGVGVCLVFPGMTDTAGLAAFRLARGGAGFAAPVVSAEVMAKLFVWAAMQEAWRINGAVLSWADPQVRNAALALGPR